MNHEQKLKHGHPQPQSKTNGMHISEVKRNLDDIKFIHGNTSKETKKETNLTKSHDLQHSPERYNQRISMGGESLTMSKNTMSRSNSKKMQFVSPSGSRQNSNRGNQVKSIVLQRLNKEYYRGWQNDRQGAYESGITTQQQESPLRMIGSRKTPRKKENTQLHLRQSISNRKRKTNISQHQTKVTPVMRKKHSNQGQLVQGNMYMQMLEQEDDKQGKKKHLERLNNYQKKYAQLIFVNENKPKDNMKAFKSPKGASSAAIYSPAPQSQNFKVDNNPYLKYQIEKPSIKLSSKSQHPHEIQQQNQIQQQQLQFQQYQQQYQFQQQQNPQKSVVKSTSPLNDRSSISANHQSQIYTHDQSKQLQQPIKSDQQRNSFIKNLKQGVRSVDLNKQQQQRRQRVEEIMLSYNHTFEQKKTIQRQTQQQSKRQTEQPLYLSEEQKEPERERGLEYRSLRKNRQKTSNTLFSHDSSLETKNPRAEFSGALFPINDFIYDEEDKHLENQLSLLDMEKQALEEADLFDQYATFQDQNDPTIQIVTTPQTHNDVQKNGENNSQTLSKLQIQQDQLQFFQVNRVSKNHKIGSRYLNQRKKDSLIISSNFEKTYQNQHVKSINHQCDDNGVMNQQIQKTMHIFTSVGTQINKIDSSVTENTPIHKSQESMIDQIPKQQNHSIYSHTLNQAQIAETMGQIPPRASTNESICNNCDQLIIRKNQQANKTQSILRHKSGLSPRIRNLDFRDEQRNSIHDPKQCEQNFQQRSSTSQVYYLSPQQQNLKNRPNLKSQQNNSKMPRRSIKQYQQQQQAQTNDERYNNLQMQYQNLRSSQEPSSYQNQNQRRNLNQNFKSENNHYKRAKRLTAIQNKNNHSHQKTQNSYERLPQNPNMHIIVDSSVPISPNYPVLSHPTPAADRNMIKLNEFIGIEKSKHEDQQNSRTILVSHQDIINEATSLGFDGSIEAYANTVNNSYDELYDENTPKQYYSKLERPTNFNYYNTMNKTTSITSQPIKNRLIFNNQNPSNNPSNVQFVNFKKQIRSRNQYDTKKLTSKTEITENKAAFKSVNQINQHQNKDFQKFVKNEQNNFKTEEVNDGSMITNINKSDQYPNIYSIQPSLGNLKLTEPIRKDREQVFSSQKNKINFKTNSPLKNRMMQQQHQYQNSKQYNVEQNMLISESQKTLKKVVSFTSDKLKKSVLNNYTAPKNIESSTKQIKDNKRIQSKSQLDKQYRIDRSSLVNKIHASDAKPKEISDMFLLSAPQQKEEANSLKNFNKNVQNNLILDYNKGKKFSLEDFQFIKVLGQGSFGTVKLVKYMKNNKYYALKCLQKQQIRHKKHIQHISNEIKILSLFKQDDFCCNLHESLQDAQNLYMVLELLPGGELIQQIRKNIFLSEEDSRFYLAEIVLAIDNLHKNNIVYRDLKPENILIDDQGHVKLIDFGFAKKLNRIKEDRTYTNCGTPGYCAPEVMLADVGHTYKADMWSIGILMCEMIGGFTPFQNHNDAQSPRSIMEKCRSGNINLPKNLRGNARDLIKQLLNDDPITRLDMGDIKGHPFFRTVNWDDIKMRKNNPPFIPDVPLMIKQSEQKLKESSLLQLQPYEQISQVKLGLRTEAQVLEQIPEFPNKIPKESNESSPLPPLDSVSAYDDINRLTPVGQPEASTRLNINLKTPVVQFTPASIDLASKRSNNTPSFNKSNKYSSTGGTGGPNISMNLNKHRSSHILGDFHMQMVNKAFVDF